MTLISEFSEDPKYTIKNVSAQTGILPVTLRAWERRYQVLSPGRSGNRYRLYSDRDVAVLRWLKSRIQNGNSISFAVDELLQFTRNGSWPEAVPTGIMRESSQSNTPPVKYARRLYQLLINYDESGAGELIREILANYDLRTITIEIFTPCLVEIGEAWNRGEIKITTEHFASAYIHGKLMSLLQAYPAKRNVPLIVIAGGPTEEHEIGALMMAVLLRSEGFRVEFLGRDIPLDDLVYHARYEKPDMIVLTATTRTAALELKRMKEKLDQLRSVPIFGYGGLAFNIEPELINLVPGIFLGKTMDTAMIKIKSLLGGEKKISHKNTQIDTE
jgi:methanogenic corrinoid protein MtbC1